jgi:hypothetical protein
MSNNKLALADDQHGDTAREYVQQRRLWSIQDAEAEALGGLRTLEGGLDAEQVKDSIELDATEQSRILRKIDYRLIPLLTLLYL